MRSVNEKNPTIHVTSPVDADQTALNNSRFEVDPWPDPVNGESLLHELTALMRRFVVLPQWAAETLSLWVLHTYAFELRDVSTYIGLESPEKRCGKTTLLTLLLQVVNRPVVASNISSPAFFRVIEEMRPTLLIDEADTLLQGNDELRGILNSGYTRKTAFVLRVSSEELTVGRSIAGDRGGLGSNPSAGSADQREAGIETNLAPSVAFRRAINEGTRTSRLVKFSCWCPKIMAAIGKLPETLADRCIVIRMQRKTHDEKCDRLRDLDETDLKRKCARFVQDHADRIAAARPAIPERLNDRAADVWEPLFALADLAGSDWAERARHASRALGSGTQERTPNGALLTDILFLFRALKTDRIFSRDLVMMLNQSLDRPWADLAGGTRITELWLARQLRSYGVTPRPVRLGEDVAKGYRLKDFQEVFPRYISEAEWTAMMVERKETEEEHHQPQARNLQAR